AGRARKEDEVSAGAGVLLRCRPGDRVRSGDVLAELRADDPERIGPAMAELRTALAVADSAPERGPLVIDRIG
ncbi:MAG: thymidine phosphorylase, partial [Actinocatenispora sp.]